MVAAVGARRRDHPSTAAPRRWTDDVLRAELEAFIGDRTTWPTADEFVDANRDELRTAVKRHGGATWWAKQLGLNMTARQDRGPYGEQNALEDARELVAQLGHVPGIRRARALGYPRFGTYLSQAGGAVAFARHHSLPPSPHRSGTQL
jgi:hypothetical protein